MRTVEPSQVRDTRSLASSLVPALIEACDGRLDSITWFKADWQRGGAATGYGIYHGEDGDMRVVIKLPVRGIELKWTRRLQVESGEPVVPRLIAFGHSLDDYDLGWLIFECFEFGPIGLHWSENHVPRIAAAIADFGVRASAYPVDRPPRVEDWDAMIAHAIEALRVNDLPEKQRWTKALKQLKPRLDDLVGEWRQRPVDEWLHGDLHLANVMSRTAMDEGPVCLIDLAEVHAGHWVEDAVYLERQLWARPERLKQHKPVREIARLRRDRGLRVDPGDSRLAMIRRGLLAATAPSFLKSEGHPKHLNACLEWLERSLVDTR